MRVSLSVVLPVRDGEQWVARALDSCLAQTLTDFELLVILNGCTDATPEIVSAFAVKDGRVRIVQSPREEGVAGAMAAGVKAATAPMIARMDADDIALPERFESQLRFLNDHPAVGVFSCGVQLRDSLGQGMQRYVEWVNGLETPEAVDRERFIECPVIQPSLLLRREVIAEAGGYQSKAWAEDHDLFLRMLARGVRFGKVSEVLFQWQDHERRLTRTHEAYAEEQVWRMKAHHLALVPAIRERGAVLCGAGPIGKRLGRLLLAEGIEVRGYFEVNPRRVGERINGVPVAGPQEFGSRWREAVLLSAVGVAGGRERVRTLAREAGYEEGGDFFAVC